MKFFWMTWLVAGIIAGVSVSRHALGPAFMIWIGVGIAVALLWVMVDATLNPISVRDCNSRKTRPTIKVPPVDGGTMTDLYLAQQFAERLERKSDEEESDVDVRRNTPAFHRPPWY